MPPVAEAFQVADGWRDREGRKMTKLATGFLPRAIPGSRDSYLRGKYSRLGLAFQTCDQRRASCGRTPAP